MAGPHRVFVVLDRNYGERVCDLTQAGPVWIIDTPLNRAAAQRFWADNPNTFDLDGVTTFKFREDSSPEDVLMDEVDTIDLHHGVHSANPPYTVIEAIGASISEKLRSKLSQFGFNQFEPTQQGFRAVRPIPSDWSPDRWR